MLIAENWRPENWRSYKRTAYTAHYCEGEIFEAGADAIYPFAFDKGKAEGKVSLIKELLAKDTTIFMGTGSELHIVSERNVAVSWKSKEPGYLAFIPIKLEKGG